MYHSVPDGRVHEDEEVIAAWLNLAFLKEPANSSIIKALVLAMEDISCIGGKNW